MQPLDPAVMRKRYSTHGLATSELAGDPVRQFARWYTEASQSGVVEPNAMVLSTADQRGRPSSRTVLLKGFDERGFVFFTNYTSRKGAELAANPYASLLFGWYAVARQVVVEGSVSRVGKDETARYFWTRPHGSQLAAWASEQSKVIASRDELDRRYAELVARYPEGEGVPVPPCWGGYRLSPENVEFWQGREHRLHDRLRYRRSPTAPSGWTVERLCP